MVVSWLGVGGQLLAKASKGPIGNYLSELEAQPGGPRGGQLKTGLEAHSYQRPAPR